MTTAPPHPSLRAKRSNPEIAPLADCPPQTSREIQVKIPPFRIEPVDHQELLATRATLQRLLPGDRRIHLFEHLVVHQRLAAVPGRKAWRQALPVLEHALREIGSDADVQRAIAFARQDIDRGLPHQPTSSRTEAIQTVGDWSLSLDCFVASLPRKDDAPPQPSLRAERRPYVLASRWRLVL